MEHVLKVGASASRARLLDGDGRSHCPLQAGHAVVLARRRRRPARRPATSSPVTGVGDVAPHHAPRPDTPNGLMEFLVVAAIRVERERGIEEISLNFSVLNEYMRAPESLPAPARARGRGAEPVLPDREPVTVQPQVSAALDPRYLVYEGRLRKSPAPGSLDVGGGTVAKPGCRVCGTWTHTQRQRTLKTANR